MERRSLLFQLVRRDFEQRFIGSAIGWIWGLIHPLVLLLSWTFVFQFCLRQKVPAGEETTNYPLFLFAGMLPWLLFSETVQRSASSLLEHANLITKTVFPSEIIPLAVFLSTLISHLLGLALMVAATGILLNQISAFRFLLPVYIALIGLFAVGIGWIVAGLHVFLRDTAQALSVVLMLWFWMTPIFISQELFPARAGFSAANPFYYVVRAYRTLLLGSTMPNLQDLAILFAFGAGRSSRGAVFSVYETRFRGRALSPPLPQ